MVMKQENIVPYNLRLPDTLKSRLTKRAKEDKRSLNQHIVMTLERDLERERSERREVVPA
jgi:predicted HicB family RNase H-like nuclease